MRKKSIFSYLVTMRDCIGGAFTLLFTPITQKEFLFLTFPRISQSLILSWKTACIFCHAFNGCTQNSVVLPRLELLFQGLTITPTYKYTNDKMAYLGKYIWLHAIASLVVIQL